MRSMKEKTLFHLSPSLRRNETVKESLSWSQMDLETVLLVGALIVPSFTVVSFSSFLLGMEAFSLSSSSAFHGAYTAFQ